MRRAASGAIWGSALAAAVGTAGACLPGSGPPLDFIHDDAGPPPPASLGDDASARGDVDLGDPFAVTGLQPSHGPWTGGTRTVIAGRGFSSNVRVWIGPTQLDPSSVVASDPTHVAVVTPAGAPGPADVRIRNVATAQERTLSAGFFYDSFVVQPDTGSTTGGTRIALRGSGTHWNPGSTVTVGGKPCTGVTFTDATDLSCSTPPAAAGSQDVTVTNPDGSIDQARDAFVYADSPDGYRGGLYGGALAGTLHVLAFDSWTGTPLAGGRAIAGSSLASAVVGTFDANGVVQLTDPSLTGHVTVTVAAKCHQPMTYVDVPVDTVTAYLDPVLDPSCAQGDPPSTGNWIPQDYGEIDGELVWQGGMEVSRGAWTNVPAPSGPNERQAAYVFTAGGSAVASFVLPPPSSATTPASDGQLGYAYALPVSPGNQTIYALAGLEDVSTTPRRFEAYAMGVVRGVAAYPNTKTTGVYVPMTTVFDHALTTVPQPPASTPRGPDRLVTTLALDLGAGSFAALPLGQATTLLPAPSQVDFVGIPALDGTLAGASYELNAAAVTGAGQGVPLSAVARIETTDANDPLTVGGFLPVPTIVQPSSGTWGGTHVALQASGAIDLVVVGVSSADGLVNWQIVAPGTDPSFDLPDLTQVPGVGTLVHGPITTTISIARLDQFTYGALRTGQLYAGAWNAYAQDVVTGSY